jgi:hypothetical protein
MRRGAFLLAAVLTFVVAADRQDSTAYPIAIKEAGKGDVRLSDVSQNTVSSTKIVNLTNNQLLQEKATSNGQHCVYRETVLDRQAGQRQSTRLRRDYQKAVVWTDGKPSVLSCQGKGVLIEKKEGVYRFSVEGGALREDEAARLLDREFNREDDLDLQRLILPGRPVRLDETWTIDMAPVARAWQSTTAMAIAARSTGTGRLAKVYRKDDRLFGVMAFRLEMPIASLGVEKSVRPDTGARVLMDVTLDCCIDGSSSSGTLRASFWVDGTATVPAGDGQQARLTFSTRGSLQKIHTDLPHP